MESVRTYWLCSIYQLIKVAHVSHAFEPWLISLHFGYLIHEVFSLSKMAALTAMPLQFCQLQIAQSCKQLDSDQAPFFFTSSFVGMNLRSSSQCSELRLLRSVWITDSQMEATVSPVRRLAIAVHTVHSYF